MEQVYKRKDFIVKFFACLFIVIFLVFTFIGSKVFASSNIVINDKNILLNDELSQFPYYIFVFKDGEFSFFASNGEFIFDNGLKTFNGQSLDFYYSSSLPFNENGFNSFSKYSINDLSKYNTVIFSSSQFGSNGINIKYSSFDLKDNSGNVVFQAPPQEKDKVLAPIVEGEEMKPLQEILQILPIVMIVVVGYLALRKGLATLFRFLRTS